MLLLLGSLGHACANNMTGEEQGPDLVFLALFLGVPAVLVGLFSMAVGYLVWRQLYA